MTSNEPLLQGSKRVPMSEWLKGYLTGWLVGTLVTLGTMAVVLVVLP